MCAMSMRPGGGRLGATLQNITTDSAFPDARRIMDNGGGLSTQEGLEEQRERVSKLDAD